MSFFTYPHIRLAAHEERFFFIRLTAYTLIMSVYVLIRLSAYPLIQNPSPVSTNNVQARAHISTRSAATSQYFDAGATRR